MQTKHFREQIGSLDSLEKRIATLYSLIYRVLLLIEKRNIEHSDTNHVTSFKQIRIQLGATYRA